MLAVAALTSVGFLADRMRLGLERDARQMIAADVLLVSDHLFDAAFSSRAAQAGLAVAHTVTFPSMATARRSGAPAGAEAPSQLAALKAVSPAIPLRGS
ncbi:hypothetical protein ACTMU2_09325 [Cupriavidus basilensis]